MFSCVLLELRLQWMTYPCSTSTPASEGTSTGHILLHLSHLNQWRQGEVHIKDGCFHGVLLTKVTVAVGISSHWHILRHLMHLNQWRQGEGHIKYGCFHVVLLTVGINSHSAMRFC